MKEFVAGLVVLLLIATNMVQYSSNRILTERQEKKIEQQNLLIKDVIDHRNALLDNVYELKETNEAMQEAGNRLYTEYVNLLQQCEMLKAKLRELMSLKLT